MNAVNQVTQLIEGMPTQNGTVTESSLNPSYELPDNSPDPNFDTAAKSAIDDIAKWFYAKDAGEPRESVEAEPQEAAPADSPVGEDVQPAAEQADEDDPKLARGIERLVARENKAREEEAKAQATLAAVKAEQAKLAELKGLKASKDLADMMDVDPIEAFTSMGKDPDEIIRRALALSLEKAGQDVPEGLKKYLADTATNRRIQALEKKNAELERAQSAAAYYNTVATGCREYVQKVDVKKFSTVATAAKADFDFVNREVMEEIVRDSQVRAATDPDGDPMSYEQAVANVEARWAKLKTLFGGQVQNGSTGKPIAQPGKNVTPPQPKPAPAPQGGRVIPPWLQKPKDIYEDGLQEALREYERAEAARKAGRLS